MNGVTFDQKAKFILYGFAFFFTCWAACCIFGKGDLEELGGWVESTAMGLWTAALILFDVRSVVTQDKPNAPPPANPGAGKPT